MSQDESKTESSGGGGSSVFNEISLNVVSFLKSQPGVTEVSLAERLATYKGDFVEWETRYSPFKLPESLKALYSLTNGVLLRWNFRFGGNSLPVGCLHLNTLAKITPLYVSKDMDGSSKMYSEAWAREWGVASPGPEPRNHHLMQALAKRRATLIDQTRTLIANNPSFGAVERTRFRVRDSVLRKHTGKKPKSTVSELASLFAENPVKFEQKHKDIFTSVKCGEVDSDISSDESDDSKTTLDTRSRRAPATQSAPAQFLTREDLGNVSRKVQCVCAFELDGMCVDGRLCLVYREGRTTHPEVWFQDLSCTWFRIATNFEAYFRLLIMHLGVSRWQYVFTEVGPDPITRQHLRFLSPERLKIDLRDSRLHFIGPPGRSVAVVNPDIAPLQFLYPSVNLRGSEEEGKSGSPQRRLQSQDYLFTPGPQSEPAVSRGKLKPPRDLRAVFRVSGIGKRSRRSRKSGGALSLGEIEKAAKKAQKY